MSIITTFFTQLSFGSLPGIFRQLSILKGPVNEISSVFFIKRSYFTLLQTILFIILIQPPLG